MGDRTPADLKTPRSAERTYPHPLGHVVPRRRRRFASFNSRRSTRARQVLDSSSPDARPPPGSRPAPPRRRPRPDPHRPRRAPHPPPEVRPRQRPHPARARGPQRAHRGGEPLVPRRLAQREAGPDGLRPSVRALLLQRLRELPARLPRGDGRPGSQQPQRHHLQRPHQLLRGRAGLGPRAHPLSRGRPHGLAGRQPVAGDARAGARRGAEREAPAGEPAVRQGLRSHRRVDLPLLTPL